MAYFPGIGPADVGPAEIGAALHRLMASLSASERRELRLFLWFAVLAPKRLFIALSRVETVQTGWLRAILGPLHVQAKGLACLVYFHHNDPTGEPPRAGSAPA